MTRVSVNGRELEISHPDKPIFPDEKITKKDLVEYYLRISERILPYLEERPVMLHRYPDGIGGKDFYQKEKPDYFPEWIDTIQVKVKKEGKETQELVHCNSAATLAYVANQASITPHVWLSRRDRIDHPDRMIYDLDPPEDDFTVVREAAKDLKNLFDELDLKSYLMTTGSKGLHVLVPLDGSADFDRVRKFARQAAGLLAGRRSDAYTVETRKEKRKGRLFLDYLRNSYGQTAVAPYALRAREGAPVATPLDWDELSNRDLDSRRYTYRNIFRRLGNKQDPWKDLSEARNSLGEAEEKLDKKTGR